VLKTRIAVFQKGGSLCVAQYASEKAYINL
jgi:hypothetical protein